MFRWILAGMLVVAGSGAVAAGAEHTADEAAIVAVLDDEGAAWKAGDAEAFAAHVRPDVSFTNTVGMFSIGKAPFVAQHRRIFATLYQGSVTRLHIQAIAWPAPGVAIVDVVSELHGAHEMPTGASAVDGVLYTRLEQVMVKGPAGWEVASFHNVPIQPKFVDAAVMALVTGTPGH